MLNPIRKILFLMLLVVVATQIRSQTPAPLKSCKAAEFKVLTDSAGVVLIDVRTPEEYSGGHIPGALNINVTDTAFVEKVITVAAQKKIALYCRSGHRSKTAASKLQQLPNQLYDLDGGIKAWMQAGMQVVTGFSE